MKKRFLLFIIFIIFLFSLVTFVLLLNYLDPYEYKLLSIILMMFTFILGVSSLLTVIIYFLKKIYYRGRVYIYHVLSSFRQWFFIALFIVAMMIFNIIWVPIILTWFLLIIIFMFLELFIQNLENN